MTGIWKKILIITVIVAVVIVVGGTIFVRLSTPEDAWICNRETGQWTKHGNPRSNLPSLPCGDGNNHVKVTGTMVDCAKPDLVSRESCRAITNRHKTLEEYIKKNISKLSKESEALGGKFHTTSIVWEDNNNAIVSYEDGHNAFTAKANIGFSSGTADIIVNSFETASKNNVYVDTKSTITDFNSCVQAGNPVLETAPEQCKAGGKTFVKLEENVSAGMANPASVYCASKGGRIEIRQDAIGAQLGICIFPNKSECEEWKFFRGECAPAKIIN